MFKRYPVCKCLIFYIAGILLAEYGGFSLNFEWKYTLTITIITFIAVNYFNKKKEKPGLYFRILLQICCIFIIPVLFLLAGLTRYRDWYGAESNLDLEEFNFKTLEGRYRVVSFPARKNDSYLACIELIEINANEDKVDKLAGTKWKLRLAGNTSNFQYGDELIVKGRFALPEDQRNPGTFDFKKYMYREKINGTIYANEKEIRVTGVSFCDPISKSIIIPVRKKIHEIFSKCLSGNTLGLMEGLIIGETGELTDEEIDDFMVSGTIHILSISGLHVVFFMAILQKLFGIFTIPCYISNFAIILLLVLYAFITGAEAPVVRATVMIVLYILARPLQRKNMPLNNIFVAAMLILLSRPADLFNAGFQLSFTAVAMLILMGDKVNKNLEDYIKTKWIRTLLFSGILSVLAQVGTAPIIARNFSRLSLISPVSNILIVPLANFLVFLGFIEVIVGLVVPWFLDEISGFIWLISWLMFKSAHFFADIPCSSISSKPPKVAFSVIYYFFLIVFININQVVECVNEFFKRLINFFKKYTNGKTALQWFHGYSLSFALTGILFSFLYLYFLRNSDSGKLESVFLDTASGCYTVFFTPDQNTIILISGKQADSEKEVKYSLAPFLRFNGVNKIDLIIMNEQTPGSVMGLNYLLKEFSVQKIATPCISELLGKNLLIRNKPELLEIYDNWHGNTETDIHLCAFRPDSSSSLNPLNLLIIYKNVSFFIPGDFSPETIKECLKDNRVDCPTIMKLNGKLSSVQFEEITDETTFPEVMVISGEKKTRKNLPSDEILSNTDIKHSRIFRTRQCGAITIKTNGISVNVTTHLCSGKNTSFISKRNGALL